MSGHHEPMESFGSSGIERHAPYLRAFMRPCVCAGILQRLRRRREGERGIPAASLAGEKGVKRATNERNLPPRAESRAAHRFRGNSRDHMREQLDMHGATERGKRREEFQRRGGVKRTCVSRTNGPSRWSGVESSTPKPWNFVRPCIECLDTIAKERGKARKRGDSRFIWR